MKSDTSSVRFSAFIFTSVVAVASAAWAQPTWAGGVTAWKPGDGLPTFLLPSTPEDYLKGVEHKVRIPAGESSELSSLPDHHRPRFAVLANEFEDLKKPPAGKRMAGVVQQLEEAGAEVYVIPVFSDAGASPKAAAEFRQWIAQHFDGMLALGGADVDPSLYRQPVTYARGLDPARDASEIAIIREYVNAEHGVMYGICRGHQICGVAQGHALIQDIPKETASHVNHKDGWHKIQVKEDSLLHRFVGAEEIEVNSFHHQAVIAKPDSPLLVVGESVEDGVSIVESTEFRNGLGLTFQFHPELMKNAKGSAMMKGMVEYAGEVRAAREFAAPGRACARLIQGVVRGALGATR